MNLINIEKITKVFAERKIFDQASFSCRKEKRSGSSALTEPERLRF